MGDMEYGEHHPTVVAALAFYALHVSVPDYCYAALRATNPDADWDTWIASCEQMREQMRDLQDVQPALLDVDA